MIIAKLVGSIVSTRKNDNLVGSKFMEVQLIKNGAFTDEYIIAIDSVGAGIGEVVLVALGSAADFALRHFASCRCGGFFLRQRI